MSKVVRYEFIGNLALFWLMCVTVILIPAAIVYMVDNTVRIDTDMVDPEKFLKNYKAKKIQPVKDGDTDWE